ncbi:restriction endonuclease subunit S [Thomasclavelia ramosa]|jgi:type I restriction enzyme S subunit|uniref:restriction endonuclease subunit S n=1 Tax=Thomasclavelia ramosa TaxID=1547 RepID=UPI001C385DBD|nr:restriction endonuclease subunit S [Thomasclavelia ramosa]MBV3128668.1 restriction endonuclease subunit S [Thomasclavelia ramosa]MBV3132409.1 restriction endonuclease subunit S [Thomasclavelia ramosa]MBV3156368.1 restriction endonuclease subunit S [Thomasclavelia ramosa]MBV3159865.1 restriction endonuclease subunit S [Thomasclavelia ramosa]MBV3174265.1 restriction endonuclease subunit S [Thomasclavelia ramosa]
MKCKLLDICSFRKGKIDIENLNTKNYISTENMLPNKCGITDASSLPTVSLVQEYKKGDVLVSNIRPYFKKIWQAKYNGGCSNDVLVFVPKSNTDRNFLYYVLANDDFFTYSMATSKGTKMPRGDKTSIMQYEVPMFDLNAQNKVASILKSLDEKIELNNAINNNLLEQVLTLYRNKFVDTVNDKRQICRADEYFDISIGKTPPRKEPQWFSTNPQDVTWVSISDMGTCGLYINSSSEQLTREAIDRHNVKIVPDNTVLLSFKLTVGRIAITDGEITTNEAIAHFKTDKKKINEYLYCYLKCFNYQTMGSTSSIATAVNSKIIKGMPFVVPTDEEIIEFHRLTAPMFAKIKANQTETSNLTKLRDTLLPKLMSGELDISNIDL